MIAAALIDFAVLTAGAIGMLGIALALSWIDSRWIDRRRR